jgi:hypothetical protein
MMVSDLDARITSQLALHRGLHTLAGPLLAVLRERLLNEKLLHEVNNAPPSLEVAQALEAVNRWYELAENVTMEQKPWT